MYIFMNQYFYLIDLFVIFLEYRMGNFFSNLFSNLFGQKELRILILGLDGAGKSKIIRRNYSFPYIFR